MLYYEAKVTYVKPLDASGMKRRKNTDVFVCHALSYADTEQHVREHVATYQFEGEMPEIDIRKVKFVDILLDDKLQDFCFYKGKIEATVLDGDGEMAKEKKLTQVYLVQAVNVEGALKALHNIGLEYAGDAEVVLVQKTNVLDYLDFYVADPAVQTDKTVNS